MRIANHGDLPALEQSAVDRIDQLADLVSAHDAPDLACLAAIDRLVRQYALTKAIATQHLAGGRSPAIGSLTSVGEANRNRLLVVAIDLTR